MCPGNCGPGGGRLPTGSARRATGTCAYDERQTTVAEPRLLGDLHGVQPPDVRDALEMVGAPVPEHEAGPGDQISDRPGAQDLVRARVGHDPRAHVDRNSSHLAVDQFALAGVQTHADPYAVVGQP